ncbi:beta-hexosaminidase subunit beta-like [Argopecten irradians]|uniref:beta-hexosaminidase subunit beta-like n=1 Tax=Argopecten irradians TaxID=31199 RepID=UPI0037182C31
MNDLVITLTWITILLVKVYSYNVQKERPVYIVGPRRGNYSSLRYNRNRTRLDIHKYRQQYVHTVKSKETENNVSIDWDYTDFSLQFKSVRGPAFKLRRAPRATHGQPWPLPQHYRTDKEKVYLIDQHSFDIKVENYSCVILEKAIKRYKDIIFKFASEEFYDNLKYLKNGGFDKDILDKRKLHDQATSISWMAVVLKETCSSYPHESSDESYSLLVKPFGVFLRSNDVWGALRGLETFSQLVYKRQNKYYIRETLIEDFPRFSHRGILIDSSRHFIKNSVFYDVIDGMVQNKMNVLHWHMVDDQSFPFVSRTFPNLSDKGAYHPSLVYRPEDIADIIEYARIRAIRVIPEFDTPGHTFAWGFGHPELLTQCFQNYRPVPGYLGPMDPSKNYTFEFLDKLFSEIFKTFSDRSIHLGGDEVPLTCWASNPDVKLLLSLMDDRWNTTSRMKDPMVKVWNYFVTRFTDNLKNVSRQQGREKRFIMWEEAMRNRLKIPNDTIIQIWLGGIREIQQAIDRGHQVIYSTCWYLDWIDHGVHWPKYYRCDPNPMRTGKQDREKMILGGEACLWSEYITNENVISLLWPRASAVAERLWSSRTVTDVLAASYRLQEHRCRMLRRGLPVGYINGPDYCVPPSVQEENDVKWGESGPDTDSQGSHIHALRLQSKPVLWISCTNELETVSLLISLIGVVMVLMMFGVRLRSLMFRFI